MYARTDVTCTDRKDNLNHDASSTATIARVRSRNLHELDRLKGLMKHQCPIEEDNNKRESAKMAVIASIGSRATRVRLP
jgi:hypothetical protein